MDMLNLFTQRTRALHYTTVESMQQEPSTLQPHFWAGISQYQMLQKNEDDYQRGHAAKLAQWQSLAMLRVDILANWLCKSADSADGAMNVGLIVSFSSVPAGKQAQQPNKPKGQHHDNILDICRPHAGLRNGQLRTEG